MFGWSEDRGLAGAPLTPSPVEVVEVAPLAANGAMVTQRYPHTSVPTSTINERPQYFFDLVMTQDASYPPLYVRLRSLAPQTAALTPGSRGGDLILQSSAPSAPPVTGVSYTPQPSASADAGISHDDGTATPSPAGSYCGETESFQIVSAALPLAQGCFQATEQMFSTPGSTGEVWSLDGTLDLGQVVVIGLADDGTGEQVGRSFVVRRVSA